MEKKIRKAKPEEVEVAVIQTVEKRYVDYWPFQLPNHSQKYNGTVSRSIAKLVIKVKLHAKVHFFDTKDTIPLIRFLVTL